MSPFAEFTNQMRESVIALCFVFVLRFSFFWCLLNTDVLLSAMHVRTNDENGAKLHFKAQKLCQIKHKRESKRTFAANKDKTNTRQAKRESIVITCNIMCLHNFSKNQHSLGIFFVGFSVPLYLFQCDFCAPDSWQPNGKSFVSIVWLLVRPNLCRFLRRPYFISQLLVLLRALGTQ